MSLLETTGPQTDAQSFEIAAAGYLTTRAGQPRTVLRRLAAIRAFGKWSGIDRPLAQYRPPTPAPPEPHPIPEGIPGVIAMATAADRREHKALIALCGLVGCRVSEACSVTPSAFDLVEHTVHITGKGKKDRIVPVSLAASAFTNNAIERATLRGTTVVTVGERRARQIISRLGMKALGHHVASHDLRATFATAAYERSGHDIRAVQELLGHATMEQTMVYTGISMEKRRAAVEVT